MAQPHLTGYRSIVWIFIVLAVSAAFAIARELPAEYATLRDARLRVQGLSPNSPELIQQSQAPILFQATPVDVTTPSLELEGPFDRDLTTPPYATETGTVEPLDPVHPIIDIGEDDEGWWAEPEQRSRGAKDRRHGGRQPHRPSDPSNPREPDWLDRVGNFIGDALDYLSELLSSRGSWRESRMRLQSNGKARRVWKASTQSFLSTSEKGEGVTYFFDEERYLFLFKLDPIIGDTFSTEFSPDELAAFTGRDSVMLNCTPSRFMKLSRSPAVIWAHAVPSKAKLGFREHELEVSHGSSDATPKTLGIRFHTSASLVQLLATEASTSAVQAASSSRPPVVFSKSSPKPNLSAEKHESTNELKIKHNPAGDVVKTVFRRRSDAKKSADHTPKSAILQSFLTITNRFRDFVIRLAKSETSTEALARVTAEASKQISKKVLRVLKQVDRDARAEVLQTFNQAGEELRRRSQRSHWTSANMETLVASLEQALESSGMTVPSSPEHDESVAAKFIPLQAFVGPRAYRAKDSLTRHRVTLSQRDVPASSEEDKSQGIRIDSACSLSLFSPLFQSAHSERPLSSLSLNRLFKTQSEGGNADKPLRLDPLRSITMKHLATLARALDQALTKQLYVDGSSQVTLLAFDEAKHQAESELLVSATEFLELIAGKTFSTIAPNSNKKTKIFEAFKQKDSTPQARYQQALAAAALSFTELQSRWTAKAARDVMLAVASSPSVLHVGRELSFTLMNNRARWSIIIGSDPVAIGQYSYRDQLTPLHSRGLDGQGEIVGISDTGLDTKSCYFVDTINSVPFNEINTMLHRKITYYNGDLNGDEFDEYFGHGTHVVGTAVGSVHESMRQTQTRQVSFDGIAPGGKVAFVDLAVEGGGLILPSPLTILFSELWDGGARVQSHSWGCGANYPDEEIDACNTYSPEAAEADDFMRTHEESLLIFAAGNSGILGFGTVASPAVAKNVLAVGASSIDIAGLRQREEDGLVGTLPTSDREENGDIDPHSSSNAYYRLRNVAEFSSVGPAFDGRVKPDIVAPGFLTVSALSSDGYTSGHTETCQLAAMTGTSTAAPAVAGAALLLRQYLRQGYHPAGRPGPGNEFVPAGSLMKAILINAAQQADYGQIVPARIPIPLPVQSPATAASTGVDGITYLTGTAIYFDTPGTYSGKGVISPAEDPDDENHAHTIVMRCQFSCSQEPPVTIPAQLAVDDAPNNLGLVVTEANVADSRLFLWESLTPKTPYEWQFTIPSDCRLAMNILEFDAPTLATAPTIARLGCDTRLSELGLFGGFDTYMFICPPIEDCVPADANDAQVWGTTFYAAESSVCQAAIHSGSISRFNYGGTTVEHGVIVAVTQLDAVVGQLGGTAYRFVASNRNGIQSKEIIRNVGNPLDLVFVTLRGSATPPNFDLVPLEKSRPNPVSGFGVIRMNTVATLAADGRDFPYGNTTHSSRRLVVLNNALDGAESRITQSSFRTSCFYISHDAPAMRDADGYDEGPDEVKVTLAWSDVAAAPATPNALIHDLDLHVFGPRGQEYRGNNQVDRLNNVEQVIVSGVDAFEGGMYCAVVNGHSVSTTQQYSLVASGRGATKCEASDDLPQLAGVWVLTSTNCSTTLIDTDAALPGIAGYETMPSFTMFQAGQCLSLRAQHYDASKGFFGLRQSPPSGSDQAKFGPQTEFALSGSIEMVGGTEGPLVAFISEGDREERLIGHLDLSSGTLIPTAVSAFTVRSYAGCIATFAKISDIPQVQGAVIMPPLSVDPSEPSGSTSAAMAVPSASATLLVGLVVTIVVGVLSLQTLPHRG